MTAQQACFSGWDIGGAHLKVARCDHRGNLLDVVQFSCPLWLGIEHLKSAIRRAQQQLSNHHDIHAITMTGELVDIFTDRKTGVSDIIDCISEFIDPDDIHVFAGELGWLDVSAAKLKWQHIASRNWQASANFCAKHIQDGLFIDIGSTTCDIIPIRNNSAIPQGLDDHNRQQTNELVYTGAIRTPLIALCNKVPFNGNQISLAAEVFATTGDCWCLLDKLAPESILDDCSDGKPWNKQNCSIRIARLLGTDASDPNAPEWRQLAQWFAEQQIQLITNACLSVLSNHCELSSKFPVIGAGVGRFIAKAVAERLGHSFIDFSELTTPQLISAADHAPAVAVALLARQQFT